MWNQGKDKGHEGKRGTKRDVEGERGRRRGYEEEQPRGEYGQIIHVWKFHNETSYCVQFKNTQKKRKESDSSQMEPPLPTVINRFLVILAKAAGKLEIMCSLRIAV